ncbi:MAG TPA: phosphate regulon transcriptional regulatory protein PhoB [Oceanospirillales bacterium]|jgi:two-component system phosphate regulon response regulator PhoB|nr:phosphate regulon transcriptional regulatory protein PhoB [Oleispira sp.]HCM05489.1 phosphate regulon transcriptional regulatory protein PhoB [Oceanospirillales bacterium]|tara:strand:- start:64 stop:768 length:705 start_codon:yes stop_codon:yes gene_type:complete
MALANILVVEDEQAIAEMIMTSLEMAGYQAKRAANGQIAYQMVLDDAPDLILADWMMPMMTGLELAKRLKREENTAEIPIILLTAKSDEDDKINGFDAGIDDYVVKPFSPRELLARIKAVLRRGNADIEGKGLTAGQLVLDRSAKKVQLAKEEINLGPLEFKLLEFFMLHPDRVYSREQLLDRVWGGNVYIEDRTVDVHIRRLRKSISRLNHDSMIQTVRGAGYRFSVEGLKEE